MIFQRPLLWGGIVAAAALGLLVLNVLLRPTLSNECPALADAGVTIRADRGAAHTCSVNRHGLRITLQHGVFDLRFLTPRMRMEARVVAIGSTGDTISITGTALTVRIPDDPLQNYAIEMHEGHASLSSRERRVALRPGVMYTVSPRAIVEKALPEQRKPQSGAAMNRPRVRITLYNGKVIEGWILRRGNIYAVQTAHGTVEIQRDDIQKENPL